MSTKDFLLPGRTIIHTVYNGKIINDKKYVEVKSQFPDNGAVMTLAGQYERLTLPGKYTHIYFHNNREIELFENINNAIPIYPLE